MRKFLRAYCLLAFVMLLNPPMRAQQVTVLFNSSVYGQTLEGLSFAQIISSFPYELNVDATIRVRQVGGGMVATMSIPGMRLRQGTQQIDRSAFSRARISFGNNYYGRTLNQSGRFPEGEYEYCFEIDLTRSKIPGITPFFENCFIQDLKPLTPLMLLNPVDGDEDCNKRPQFTWQPPMPIPPGARFRLVLTELKEKQDIVEAINFNPPIINQANIPVNQLNYPFNAPELQIGKKYVWQVTMYTDKVLLKKSEIWLYKVKCEDQLPVINGDGYRELKEGSGGDYYVANRILRFSFNNPYTEGDLSYSIVNLASRSVEIKNLPKFYMRPGLNKYDLDLSENNEFKNGQEYLLSVRLGNGRRLDLRFIYKNE